MKFRKQEKELSQNHVDTMLNEFKEISLIRNTSHNRRDVELVTTVLESSNSLEYKEIVLNFMFHNSDCYEINEILLKTIYGLL